MERLVYLRHGGLELLVLLGGEKDALLARLHALRGLVHVPLADVDEGSALP